MLAQFLAHALTAKAYSIRYTFVPHVEISNSPMHTCYVCNVCLFYSLHGAANTLPTWHCVGGRSPPSWTVCSACRRYNAAPVLHNLWQPPRRWAKILYECISAAYGMCEWWWDHARVNITHTHTRIRRKINWVFLVRFTPKISKNEEVRKIVVPASEGHFSCVIVVCDWLAGWLAVDSCKSSDQPLAYWLIHTALYDRMSTLSTRCANNAQQSSKHCNYV